MLLLAVSAFAQDQEVELRPGCVPTISLEEYRSLLPHFLPEPVTEPLLTAGPGLQGWRVEAVMGRTTMSRVLGMVPGIRVGVGGPTHLDRPMRIVLDGAALTSPLL